ncbi:hypothetical protein BC827DRAFT_1197105 [Russula dissimulans]|nr:hypothetical protein BC827DRAFT_1197105 [Russula dissimulans]
MQCVQCLYHINLPSSIERTVRCVASVSMVVLPITLSLSFVPLDILSSKYPSSLLLVASILGVQMVSYLYCRLALLILPFLALRSLPPAAYHVVHWTLVIPHV